MIAAIEPEPCVVWPENWAAVEVFFRCMTQWRFAGMNGVPTGLDYASVRVVLEYSPAIKPRDRADAFEAVQVLEGFYLNEIRT